LFEITHPFHPLHGNSFVLVSRRLNWGEDRVMYFDANKRLRHQQCRNRICSRKLREFDPRLERTTCFDCVRLSTIC
jgi:hypothetical protein